MWAIQPGTSAPPAPIARDRYVPMWSGTRRRYVIVDRDMRDVCTLPDADGMCRVLVFMTDAVATAYLHGCYRAWHDRPKVGRRHPAPLPLDG